MAVVSTLLSAASGATNIVQKGGSLLSLAGATKALLKPDTVKPGIAGLIFAIPESETLTLQAQITDHVVEDNSTMQDHIALSPIRVTLTGKVSELVLTKSSIEQYAETVLTTLGSVGALSPALSVSAAQALSTINRAKQAAEQTLGKLSSIKDIVTGNTTLNKQQSYYLEIKQMFYGRGLFTVETPWETLNNMAIENVTFDQDETTSEWTTVSVSLKQITLAQTKQLTQEIQGRAKYQSAADTVKGKVSGKSVAAGIYDSIKSSIFGK